MSLLPHALAPLSVLLIGSGYLLGSLSGPLMLGRIRGDSPHPREPRDPQDAAPAASFVRWGGIAIDVGKAALAAWLALRLAPVGDALPVTAHGYLAGMAAMLGHAWPVWHRFRGTAGPAALAGCLLVLWPTALAITVVVGLLALLWCGDRGLSTVLATAVTLPLLAWLGGADVPRLAFALSAPVLLIVTHRRHLLALGAGTEPRFARARLLHRWRRR